MVDETERQVPRRSSSVVSNNTERAMTRARAEAERDTAKAQAAEQQKAEEVRKPRVILTDGAIVRREWLHDSVVKDNDNLDGHQMCSIGDKVMMTDEEFDAHRAAGVCMVNEDERDAA